MTYNLNGIQYSDLAHLVVQTEEATIAVVSLDYDGKDYKGVGDAKRHPTDAHDPEYAHNLALSRAFTELALNLVTGNTDD
jgi:hypothetical protein